jgi:NTE family protein
MHPIQRLKDIWRARLRPGSRDSGRRLALALQGGGALGAFTWGVLDRLLEAPGFRFAGVSGASAGAVNAVVLAAAWVQGGAPASRQALDRFWQRISEAARLPPFGLQPFQSVPGFGPAAGALALDVTTRLVSPYQFNPLELHPLREILAETVDFAALMAPACPPVVISATRIADGTARLFGNAEITLDTVLASAALPSLNHAVEIDGEAYWDGGYVANPPLRALVAAARPDALLVVQLNPLRDDRLPRQAPDIIARLNQIVFNRPLLDELAFLAETRPGLPVHRLVIDADHPALRLGSALSLDLPFLQALRQHGRDEAADFLAGGVTGR